MLISVCIPTYNGQQYIAESLKSVLKQSHHELEVVIADHGSSDSTLDIVKSFQDDRIRIVNTQRSSSIADNWNHAVRVSRGALIKVMGQDDILYSNALQSELAVLKSYETDVAFCFSNRDIINPASRVTLRPRRRQKGVGRVAAADLIRLIVRSGTNPIGEPVAVLFRRRVFEQVGGFRGDYVIDLDLYIRLLGAGDGVWTGECIGAFRVHAQSWGSNLIARQYSVIALSSALRNDRPQIVRQVDVVIGTARTVVLVPLRAIAQQLAGSR